MLLVVVSLSGMRLELLRMLRAGEGGRGKEILGLDRQGRIVDASLRIRDPRRIHAEVIARSMSGGAAIHAHEVILAGPLG